MKSGIQLRSVTFQYPEKPPVLRDISLFIEKGDFVGITGVNGSGKSTLTYLLNSIIPHAIPGQLTGEITINGINTREKSIAYFASQVGMVFQNPDFSLFNLTVADEIAFGRQTAKSSIDASEITKLLKRVGLDGFESRDPQTLSFGEKQKVSIASVLALDVSYIVLDEPTAMLDYASSISLYQLLQELNREGKTIITIEHDTDFLWAYTKRTAIIDRGTIKAYGKTNVVLSNIKQLKQLGIKRPHSRII